MKNGNISKEIKKKPNLLIYAHYYHPDVASTGQILKELAEGMLDSFNITVICVVPSYSGKVSPKYKIKKYYYERINGVNILRVRVPDFNKTSKRSRIINILTYFFRAIWATFKIRNIDYVYSISQPPILGGIIGLMGKWIKHAKYIYNIQDFNPEQIIAIGYSKNFILLKLMLTMDKISCRRANKVIIVGRDMLETLKIRFSEKKIPNYAFVNNWIDEKKIYPLESNETHVISFKENYGFRGKFVIMYSGNLGYYYDLESIIKVIKKIGTGTKTKNCQEVAFVFVGDGSIRDYLLLYKENNHMDNVYFIPYQDKENLIYSLNAADVHWCMNAKGIKGVSVPSKLYGIMAAGKPVLGVLEKGSEGRLIIEETNCGLVCNPGDYDAVEKNIRWFIDNANTVEQKNMGIRGREYLIKNLTKDVSVMKYIKEIKSC